MRHLKQGKISWFDVATAVWAIALVVVATTWFAAPAAARPGGGGADCDGVCANVCPDDGGYCIDGWLEGNGCHIECSTGSDWIRLINCDV